MAEEAEVEVTLLLLLLLLLRDGEDTFEKELSNLTVTFR